MYSVYLKAQNQTNTPRTNKHLQNMRQKIKGLIPEIDIHLFIYQTWDSKV